MKIFTVATECVCTFMNLSLTYVLNAAIWLHWRNLENQSLEAFEIWIQNFQKRFTCFFRYDVSVLIPQSLKRKLQFKGLQKYNEYE